MDASILITANVPSAKKIIVHGPTEPDEGAIPSQFPISEDIQVRMLMKFTLAHANLIIGMVMSSIITKRNSLQFCQLQQEALDFFGIEESKMLVEKILRFCYCHFVTFSLSHFVTLSGVLSGGPEDPKDPQPSSLCQRLLLFQEVLLQHSMHVFRCLSIS